MSRSTTKRSVIALLTALFATAIFAVAAGSASASSKTQVLKISVKGSQLAFNTDKLSAKPGTIEIVLSNPKNSGISHGIAISGKGVNKVGKVVAPGKTSTVTVKLGKGKYTYYCPVPGHEMAGMKGTLTVS